MTTEERKAEQAGYIRGLQKAKALAEDFDVEDAPWMVEDAIDRELGNAHADLSVML